MKEMKFDIQRFNENYQNNISLYFSGNNLNNYGNDVKINGNSGNDYIYNEGTDVTIYGGDGDDTVFNWGWYTTIRSGYGNDSIKNYASNVSISFSEGVSDVYYKNYIYNTGFNVTIYGGYGNDSIYSANNDGTNIYGNLGSDTINIYSSSTCSINAGQNDDLISLKSVESGITVNGAGGNDQIYGDSVSSYGILYQYEQGDGTDTIYGIKSNDTIKITGEKYEKVTTSSSNDVTLKVGDESILVKNGKNISFKIDGTLKSGGNTTSNTLISGSNYNDSIHNNTAEYVTIYAYDGADTITGIYYNSKIYGGYGNDSINVIDSDVYKWGYSLMLSKYTNLRSIFGDNFANTIDGGEGDDTINIVDFNAASINGGNGDDKISLSGDNPFTPHRTVKGGKGNDIIYGIGDERSVGETQGYQGFSKSGTYYEYSYGDGSDTIYNYHATDTISIAGTSSYTTLTSGDNVIVSIIGSGAITLYNDTYNSTKNGKINIEGGTFINLPSFTSGNDYYSNTTPSTVLNALSGNDTVINSATNVTINGDAGADSISNSGQSAVINGGTDNDKIYNSANYVTITGGTGNDSISLSSSAYNNVIKYSTGADGYDTVSGYDSNDTISLSGGYYTRETLGTDVRISLVSGGAITLSGASSKTINIVGGTLSVPAAFTNGADYYSNNKSSTVLNALSGNDTVINSATNVTINGDAGADSISNSGQSAVINGGADNDKIYNSASYVTITGGANNDNISLSSSAYNNVIKYSSGDGYDTIYGLNSDDTLNITSGSISKSVASGNDVILTVGNGTMTLKDVAGATTYLKIGNNAATRVTLPTEPPPAPSVTQQEVIKKFMGVLDTVTSSGIAALNQAVSVASGGLYGNSLYININDAISAMVADCKKASSGNDFLLNYCGINLYDAYGDTGAITGKDAGGSTAKTSTSIVPENSPKSVYNFTGNSFTVNGLTVKLADIETGVNIFGNKYIKNYTIKNYSNLNSDIQRYIWQAFRTWWAEGALDLIAESYGNNYSFNSSSSSATAKTLYFGFNYEPEQYNGITLAATAGPMNSTDLVMYVNTAAYDNSRIIGDPNGYSYNKWGNYLDRTLAHEMTHAIMRSTVNYSWDLPQFINEGMAELTHGIDDERESTIIDLATNPNKLEKSLSMGSGTGDCPAYAGGYMFLRWLAKKSSEWSANPASQISTTGNNLASQALGGNGSYKDITTNGNTVTVAKTFNGSRIDLTAFDSTVTKVDATALTKGIWIIGNERANSIVSGSGADSISGNTGNDTINGGSGNDVIMGDAGNDSLFGGVGNDTISGGSGKNDLTGGTGNDIFVHNGGNDLITDYEVGKDKIQIANGYIGNYSISGSNVIFTTMNGNITVSGGKDKKITIIDQDGKETTQIYPSVTPDPTPTLPSGWKYGNTAKTKLTASVASAANIDLNQTYGTSVTTVDGSKITAARTFTGNSKANSIKGGSGADTIYGNTGADILYGSSGNDKIYGGNDNDKLYGDAGNDSLYGNSGNDTLTGGAGNDTFFYETGNDVITDYVAGTDKIKLVSSSITSSSLSGSDVVLKTSSGNITVQNAKSKKITVIDKNGKETTQIYPSVIPDPTPTLPSGWKYGNTAKTKLTASVASAANIDLNQTYGTSVATVDGSKITAARTFTGNSKANSIKGGSGADIIYGNTGADILYGGSGNDKIYGGNDNDKLYGDAGNDSLYGNSGNDTLTGGAGNDTFFYENGNDTITDYTARQDKIKFSVAISSSSVSGSNVIFKTSNGNVTVQNGKGKKITVIDKNGKETTQIYPSVTPDPTPTLPSGWKYGNTAKTKLTASVASAANIDLNQTYGTSVATVDGSKITAARTFTGNSKANSIKGGSGADIIYGNAGADILYGGGGNDKIYGGNDNDKLYGDAGNDSLYGNSGNDTLTGGAGNDTFFYENGNDTITDYTAGQDKIKFSVAISSSSVSGSNVIFKTSNGNVTVQNGKGKKITVIDKNGKETTQIYPSVTPDPTPTLPSGWKYGNTAKTKLTASVASAANIDLNQTYGTSVATVDGSKITAARTFTGNSKANSIKGGSGADTIYGNAGADILYGGSGNDKIYGGNDNDKLYGDSGNDSLYGGNGNDTLTGGAGNDVFVYEGGKDVITDYTAGQDKIKISSGKISKTTYSGKDVIFTIGSGTLTVKNSKGKKITVTDSGNKAQTYSKTLDLLYDNNFVSDEFALDDISEVSANNYSVGKLENSENHNNNLVNDSIVSVSYFDEK